MADVVLQHDVADLGSIRILSAPDTLTAGGTGDATLVTGIALDRFNFANGSLPMSAEFAVLFDATLSVGKTLSITFDVQHSPDNTIWTDFQTQAAVVVATGPTGGGTVVGQSSLGVDLTMANRYVRMNFTPDLSATSVDTAIVVGAGFFAGFDRLPAPL
jgi:hypothetical protein